MTKEQLKVFFEKLYGSEGCNFRQDKKGEHHWNCASGDDKTLTTNILKKMGIADEEIKSFLKKCHKYGGHCDCEIIFNAMEHFIKPDEDIQLTSDEIVSRVKMKDSKTGKITIKVAYINGCECVKITPSEMSKDYFNIYLASAEALVDLIAKSMHGEYAKNARLLCERVIDLHEQEIKLSEKETGNEQKTA